VAYGYCSSGTDTGGDVYPVEISNRPADGPFATTGTTAANEATTATNQASTATNHFTGGNGTHNNMPPFIAVNYIIRAL